ncbi:MAG: class I SAM-dependent methyltransferase [Campylobacterota bacterium]
MCPICFTESGNYSVIVDTIYKVCKCSDCGLEYTVPNPNDQVLQDFYHTYHDVRADTAIVRRNAKRNLKKLELLGIKPDDFILDFGCGKGEFVDVAGERCFGIELNPDHPNSRVKASFETLPHRSFHAITLWGVLEHLNNILPTLQILRSHLDKDGFMIMTTVDAEGVIPYYYKPPEHLTYWTKKSFEILAEILGMKIIAYEPYMMEQNARIYLERLLSRTPLPYRESILNGSLNALPEIVEVPTNEIFVVMQSKGPHHGSQ